MELSEAVSPVKDGAFAFAKIQDWDGHLIHRKRRVVFVQDTLPEKAVRNAKSGDCFRVLGIPRLDLALVSWRVKNAKTRPEVLTWNLPYEMIIVAVYNETCAND